ncbi:hypothetical protein E2C01_013398 [Portunus trituberculatus]|uniref:Uncharacterized protein n=1 Tax=Portunus trituberculatus TaxID=210409 RepID=A0A5B7DH80_PORTR|nr:hypothetical protein [Portunus trituberculatus]
MLVIGTLRLRQAVYWYKTYGTRQHQQQGNMSCLPDDHHCNLDVSGGSEEQREETEIMADGPTHAGRTRQECTVKYLEFIIAHVAALLTHHLATLHLHCGLVTPGLLHHLYSAQLEDSIVDIRLVKPLVRPLRTEVKPALRLPCRLSCIMGPLTPVGSAWGEWLLLVLRGRLVRLLESCLLAACLTAAEGECCIPVLTGDCWQTGGWVMLPLAVLDGCLVTEVEPNFGCGEVS